METVEIIIYLFAAIFVGGILIFTIKQVDHQKNYQQALEAMKNKDVEVYNIEKSEFAKELSKRWTSCRMGIDNMTSSVYVRENGTINREHVILELKREDQCDAIDCSNNSGRFSIPENITIPKIINIRCFNSTLIVR